MTDQPSFLVAAHAHGLSWTAASGCICRSISRILDKRRKLARMIYHHEKCILRFLGLEDGKLFVYCILERKDGDLGLSNVLFLHCLMCF